MTDSNKFRGKVVSENSTIYISSTSFMEAVKCPMRGYIGKKLGLQAIGSMPAALAFGIAVHEAMEKYLTLGLDNQFPYIWGRWADQELYFNRQEESHSSLMDKGVEIVKGMIDTLKMINAGEPYKIGDTGKVTVECQDFVDIAPGVVLVRTLDAILPVEGIPTVIDFKTAGRMYSTGLQDDISEQLTAYSLPHSFEGVPQPEQVAFIVGTKTKNPSAAYFPAVRNKYRQDALKKDIKIVARMFESGEVFHNRGQFTCGSAGSPMCDYRPICYKTEPGSRGWRHLYEKRGNK